MEVGRRRRSGVFLNLVVPWILAYVVLTSRIRGCEAGNSDEFTEELFLRSLPSGYVYSYFQFTTKWNVTPDTNAHFHLFPKSLGEILVKHDVRELHFSLTQGLWRYQTWGYPTVDAGPGMELWVWFHETATNLDVHYSELTNALSGLFCASLNFIDSSNTASPKISFRPSGVTPRNFSGDSSFLRYSILPREVVCTENLTPWKKLLPCDTKAGLSTLLNAVRLYNTVYHSLGVHVRPTCQSDTCSKTALELTQTMSVVSDLQNRNKQDWSIAKLYGRTLTTFCPLAKLSQIYVDVTNNETSKEFFVNPEPNYIADSVQGATKRQYAVYDLKDIFSKSTDNVLNVASKYSQPMSPEILLPPPLYVSRFVTGFGQEFGGIRTLIYNTERDQTLTVVYLEMIPWFLRTFLHTLEIMQDNVRVEPAFLHFVPSEDRLKPSFLEVALSLPPDSVTKVTIQFEQTLLKWTEYPPDANHGFYVGSAVISANLPSAKNYTGIPQQASTFQSSLNMSLPHYFIRLHSEPLLILLPTPDFSMPYNVICLTCTVIALAFGPLHNLTIKRLEIKDPSKPNFNSKIKGFVNRVLSKIKRKPSASAGQTGEEKKNL